jgi:hypothetical protein
MVAPLPGETTLTRNLCGANSEASPRACRSPHLRLLASRATASASCRLERALTTTCTSSPASFAPSHDRYCTPIGHQRDLNFKLAHAVARRCRRVFQNRASVATLERTEVQSLEWMVPLIGDALGGKLAPQTANS